MNKENIIERLLNLKEMLHEVNTSTEVLSEEIDSIMEEITGIEDRVIDDPFTVDEELDNFLDNNKFGMGDGF